MSCRKYVAVYLMLVLGGNASPSVADGKSGYVPFDDSCLRLPLQDLETLLTMGAKRLVNLARSQPSKCGVGAWPVPPVYPSDARERRRVLGEPSSSEESPVRCVLPGVLTFVSGFFLLECSLMGATGSLRTTMTGNWRLLNVSQCMMITHDAGREFPQRGVHAKLTIDRCRFDTSMLIHQVLWCASGAA
jgi:hypothetical protein